MLSKKEAMLTRLMLEANHLQRIQCLLQENAACTQLLREIDSVNRALTAIELDLIQWNVSHCLFILQICSDNEMQAEELKRLIQLLFAV